MKRLKLADEFEPPIDLMTQKIAILARTGAGKTNTATVIAEEVLEQKQQVVVLDPKGDWYGLRSSADGEKPGYPITVVGGDHGDLPLEPTAGKVIADVAAEGASLVIDLSTFSGAEMRRFVTDFAETFYRAKAQHVSPVLLVFEEADEVVPQRFTGEAARMVGAIERIVKRGRFRGIGTLLVTQRSASLNKDVLTQTEVLIVQQTTSPQDKKAIDAWVESHQDQDKRAELMANVASLKKGEAFVWSPTFLEAFFRTRFRLRRTFDAGRDVKVGEFRPVAHVLAPVDLAALGAKMKATIERAKADDPAALKARIRELETAAKKEQFTHAQKLSPTTKEVLKVVEKPVLTPKAIAAIERLAAAGEKIGSAGMEWHANSRHIMESIKSALSAGASTEKKPYLGTRVGAPAVRAGDAPEGAAAGVSRPPSRLRVTRGDQPTAAPRTDLGKGERVILSAIAQHQDGVTRDQLTVLTGYKRSSRDTYLQRLTSAGLAEQNGGGAIYATEAGVAALGDAYEPLPTGDALRAYWLDRLKAGEKVILATLTEAYPESMTRDELSERVDYKKSSRDTYLQRLIARKLVTADRGTIRASEALFG